jgi:DNA-directed RNA polymerase II subunit RPB11
MSGRINQPNRIESWVKIPGEKRLKIVEDPKIANAATVSLFKEDHTLGNMLRAQLLLDPSVLFAGYKMPHPSENTIVLKIQTDERSNPAEALKRACQLLILQTKNIQKQFQDQARNIDMGMGPDNAIPATTGYDPYGDGFDASPQTVGGQVRNNDTADVYDF